MTKEQFAARLKQACASVISAEQELTEIDSKFGDADHGLTMTKIAKAISDAVDQSDGGIQAMLDDAATAVMSLNGGSAVPLWNTWLDGMQEAAPEGEEIDVPGLQAVFAQALEEQLRHRAGSMEIGAVFFSNQYGVLGKTAAADNLLARHGYRQEI